MDWKRQTGLSARGWLVFWAAAAVLLPGLFFGALAVGRVLIVPAPAITPSPAGAVSSPTSPGPRPSSRPAHHRARPSHRASSPAVSTGQARIPGVSGTGGYGVTSVPPATHYRPRPAPASTPPVSTPVPQPGTETPSAAPTETPTDTPAGTGTAPATATTSATGGGWGGQGTANRVLPDVPGGGSGWVPGQ